MNEKNPHEIENRRRAFKLFEKGISIAQILNSIPRSRSWLFKWKKRFERGGWEALDSLSKAPANSPQEHSEETIELVLGIRERLEKSEIGLVGPHEIREEIKRNRLMEAPPSLASIKRWLNEAGYTTKAEDSIVSAYYPILRSTDDLAILSCDWIARYLTGGVKVFAFHTINLQTHGLAQTIGRDKSAPTAFAHLLEAFSTLGLPDFLQMDNDAAFTGLGCTKPVFGRIIRLLLYLGIEVIFIPPGEPKRNGVVERVNGLWARAFWDKNHFSSFREVLRKSPKFLTWYQNYQPPSLGGLTVQEASDQKRLSKLQPRQIQQLPKKLPLTAGRLHFIRKVDRSGEIDILKEHWRVSKTLAGNYVWATIDLCKKQLLIYGRHSLRAAPRQIRKFAYEINEPMQCLRPEYRRRARKLDILQRI